MEQSLEYCSLHYLNMWLKHDRIYHDALNNHGKKEKLLAIKKAAQYYKVSRNLPKKHETGERLSPVLKAIDKLTSDDFEGNKTIKSIEKAKEKISIAYGGINALSFSTKILWVKIQDPIVIYDSKACAALDIKKGSRDLSSFYEKWHAAYERKADEIASACQKLSRVAPYSYYYSHPHPNDDFISTTSYIKEISESPWFQKRVFDMHLWHKAP